MKILHTADWHVGKGLRGRSRADEHRAVLAEITDLARAEAVDVVLAAGDLFDSATPSPEAEEIVFGALLDLAATGAEVVVVAGNHDHPQRLRAVKPVLERGGGIHVGAELARPADGGILRLDTASGERLEAVLFPFLSQRRIVSAADLVLREATEHLQSYAARSRQILAAFAADLTPGAVHLLVGHLLVTGATPGGGERAVHLASDYGIAATAFDPERFHYVALGHIHRSQSIPAGCPVWYCGSPLTLDFGEREDEKVVLVVDVGPDRPAEVRPVALAAGRRLRVVRGSLAALEALRPEIEDDLLRVVVDEAPQPGLGDAVRELYPEAVDVRISEAHREGLASRATDPGDRSPRDLFAAYLAEQGVGEAPTLLDAFDRLLETVESP